jgi:hypothetical protein
MFFVNNIVYNGNQGFYTSAGGGCTFVIYNNTLIETAWGVYISASSYTDYMRNNLHWQSSPGALKSYQGGFYNTSNNAYVVGGGGEGSNSIDISGYSLDQIFKNKQIYDFHLRHGSPCFAKGVNLRNHTDGQFNVLEDIDGDETQYFSMGADDGACVPLFSNIGKAAITGKSNSSLIRIRGK